MRTRQLGAVVVVAIAAALIGAKLRGHHHGSLFPRFRRELVEPLHSAAAYATRADPRGRALMQDPPTMPKPAVAPSVGAYRSAIAHGDGHPGAASFRADIDAYCDFNRDAVEAQARTEGITVGEVRELTYFGFVAMRTTQRQTVEGALGRALSTDESRKLDELLAGENQDFTSQMRGLVDRGASEDERWQLIRDFEDQYQQQYAMLFGMSSTQFDLMLAPDPAAPAGAPAVELPSDVPPPSAPQTPPAPSGGGLQASKPGGPS
jgi:hypothetical protein